MDTSTVHLIALITSWITYGILHSLTASLYFKQAFQQRYPDTFYAYRLLFNITALLLLIIPLWLLQTYEGDLLWQWPGTVKPIADSLGLLALLGFVFSITLYHGSDFIGLNQFRNRHQSLEETAPMSLSWLHRYVRHPWYFFGWVMIWSREMNTALLATAVTLTLYLIIGSRFEETKLIDTYGEQYRRYIKAVPGLIPLPWRYLHKAEADALLALKNK
jgi:protein-S-isoprenylcysteine O-methyltransferase Ste14